LDDVEIDALVAAVNAEAERRGRRPLGAAKEKRVADAKPQRRQEVAEDGAGSLTTGKLNAVRAAFKAGVKPSAIARQFGISQSDVKGTGARQASRSLISIKRSHCAHGLSAYKAGGPPAGAKPALSGFSPNGLILKTCSANRPKQNCAA